MITLLHIQKSLKRTGKPFKEVHEWLDMCTTQPYKTFEKYPMQHRLERHTPAGLEYIRKMWGEEALIEAVVHLQDDGYKLKMEKKNGKIEIIWL